MARSDESTTIHVMKSIVIKRKVVLLIWPNLKRWIIQIHRVVEQTTLYQTYYAAMSSNSAFSINYDIKFRVTDQY